MDISPATRGYFGQPLCDRLNKLNSYLNLATACATLKTVPFGDLRWGASGMGSSDNSEHLCLDGRRISLWAVAEVVFPNFRKKGLPIRKPGVLFRPLLSLDFKQAARILNVKSSPPKGT